MPILERKEKITKIIWSYHVNFLWSKPNLSILATSTVDVVYCCVNLEILRDDGCCLSHTAATGSSPGSWPRIEGAVAVECCEAAGRDGGGQSEIESDLLSHSLPLSLSPTSQTPTVTSWREDWRLSLDVIFYFRFVNLYFLFLLV